MIDFCHSLPFLATPGKGDALQKLQNLQNFPCQSRPGDNITVATQHSVQAPFLECCFSKHNKQPFGTTRTDQQGEEYFAEGTNTPWEVLIWTRQNDMV